MITGAISQNATDLAPSCNGEEAYPFDAVVARIAERKVKGNTVSRWQLSRQNLIDSVKQNYRDTFASIYGRSAEVPQSVYVKITQAVERLIEDKLSLINPLNSVNLTVRNTFKSAKLCFVERVTAMGENAITLERQLSACDIETEIKTRSLNEEYKRLNPREDRIKALNEIIKRLELCRTMLVKEIAAQNELRKELVK